jgi:hypothetical protein
MLISRLVLEFALCFKKTCFFNSLKITKKKDILDSEFWEIYYFIILVSDYIMCIL